MTRFKANTLLGAILLVIGLLVFQLSRNSKYFPDRDKDYYNNDCTYEQIDLIINEGRPFIKKWIKNRYGVSNPIINIDKVEDECHYEIDDDEKSINTNIAITWEQGILPPTRYEVVGRLEIFPANGFLKKYKMYFTAYEAPSSESIIKEVTREIGTTFKDTILEFLKSLFS